jgi:hypothetical protein
VLPKGKRFELAENKKNVQKYALAYPPAEAHVFVSPPHSCSAQIPNLLQYCSRPLHRPRQLDPMPMLPLTD